VILKEDEIYEEKTNVFGMHESFEANENGDEALAIPITKSVSIDGFYFCTTPFSIVFLLASGS